MHNNWPQGNDLRAASARGDLIREMLRDRGYSSVVAIMEDILASVSVEERRERAAWAERQESRGALVRSRLHTLSAEEATAAALEEVAFMLAEADKG